MQLNSPASRPDRGTWIDFTILSEATKGKTDKISEAMVSGHWTSGNNGL